MPYTVCYQPFSRVCGKQPSYVGRATVLLISACTINAVLLLLLGLGLKTRLDVEQNRGVSYSSSARCLPAAKITLLSSSEKRYVQVRRAKWYKTKYLGEWR